MNVTKTKQRSKRRNKRDIEENEEDEVTNLESLTEEVLEDFGSYQKVCLLTPVNSLLLLLLLLKGRVALLTYIIST